ncbi:transposase [Streptomyces sp. MK5]|uniref:transposase n=1 Tax=Streptomyces sp. MK5 TaxID=3064253 RepID=UPI0035581CF6
MTRAQLADAECGSIGPYPPTGGYGPYPQRLRQQFEGVIWRTGTGGRWRKTPRLTRTLPGCAWAMTSSLLWRRLPGGVVPRIARRDVESSQRLGRHRCVVERTMSWLAGCRRLHRRYERKAEHFLAFAGIAAALICRRRLVDRPR